MKKMISILLTLAVILSCTLFTGCGENKQQDLSGSKYVGTWKAASMSLMEASEDFDSEILLILNGDGTAKFIGDDEETECAWEEIDGGFKLKDGVKMTFKDDGDGVKSTIMGVELHFERA